MLFTNGEFVTIHFIQVFHRSIVNRITVRRGMTIDPRPNSVLPLDVAVFDSCAAVCKSYGARGKPT